MLKAGVKASDGLKYLCKRRKAEKAEETGPESDDISSYNYQQCFGEN